MEKKDFIQYWMDSSKHDLEVATSLFNSKHYDYCLYLAHLSLEKILKAVWVKNNIENNPPLAHNLVYLAEQAKVNLNDEQLKFMQLVNTFNIGIRYPDYKFKIYQMCNQGFSEKNLNKVKDMHEWLMKKL